MPRNAVTTLSIGASRAVLLTLLVIALILVLQRVLGPFYRFIGNVNLFYKKSSSVMKAEIDIAVARDQCAKNYGSVRSFNPNSTAITHPPILYSFPGSGSNWCRLLIEYSIGMHTGSVYSDKRLVHMLHGEGRCDEKVAAIKVHSDTHGYKTGARPLIRGISDPCANGIVRSFRRAIILVRNPYHAIWSSYQMKHSRGYLTDRIHIDQFNKISWMEYAMKSAIEYAAMWNHYHHMKRSLGVNHILVVKYESLESKDSYIKELSKLLNFMGHSSSEERKQCAFLLSDEKEIHRNSSFGADYISRDDAYDIDPIVCNMWNIFRVACQGFGYRPYYDLDCPEKLPSVKRKKKDVATEITPILRKKLKQNAGSYAIRQARKESQNLRRDGDQRGISQGVGFGHDVEQTEKMFTARGARGKKKIKWIPAKGYSTITTTSKDLEEQQ